MDSTLANLSFLNHPFQIIDLVLRHLHQIVASILILLCQFVQVHVGVLLAPLLQREAPIVNFDPILEPHLFKFSLDLSIALEQFDDSLIELHFNERQVLDLRLDFLDFVCVNILRLEY